MKWLLLMIVCPSFIWGVSPEQTQAIHKIIKFIDSHSILSLAINKGKIKKDSKLIKGVSPLDFIGVILDDPDTHQAMKNILDSSIKSRVLVYRLSNGIKSRSKHKNFLKTLEPFSIKYNKNFNKLKILLKEEDWGGFIKILIY